MRRTAAQHVIHLAGSLMLLDGREIYNALLLLAPDGRTWRYDKSYPWGWERAYYRPGEGITVAQTDLGDIGLMICWDAAHCGLWRRHAGQVDLMVISSCPPDVTNPAYVFQNGDEVTLDGSGLIARRLEDTGRLVFGAMVNQQTAWLGLPTAQSGGAGHIRTPVPKGVLSLIALLPAEPGLIKYLPNGRDAQLVCGFIQGCKIVDGTGNVKAQLERAKGEAYVIATVVLRERCPRNGSLSTCVALA